MKNHQWSVALGALLLASLSFSWHPALADSALDRFPAPPPQRPTNPLYPDAYQDHSGSETPVTPPTSAAPPNGSPWNNQSIDFTKFQPVIRIQLPWKNEERWHPTGLLKWSPNGKYLVGINGTSAFGTSETAMWNGGNGKLIYEIGIRF